MYLKALIVFGFVASASCFSFFQVAIKEWDAFKAIYQKVYNEVEESFRMKIFMENKYKIATHNKQFADGQKSYGLKMNEFGDLLPGEFRKVMNGLKKFNLAKVKAHRNVHAASFVEPDEDVQLPKAVDWRDKGAVTPVKNQGQCGSCWAFSATGSLEGQHFRQTGKLVSLSEQNLVDCSTKYGNNGCNGGLMDYAFQYIKENHGIDTEKSYPYEAEDDTCHYSASTVGADDKGYVDVRNGSEKALKKAVATIGPISVAIDASDSSFQFYSHGVFYEPGCSSTMLDHGVLAVGYGTEEDDEGEDEDYWLVKNSWGTTWGLDGYIKMARNRDNNCGIASSASYPLV